MNLRFAFHALFSLLLHVFPVSAVTVTVDIGTTYQEMDGFGFSQAFGRANDVKNLPAAQQRQTLDLLFNITNGAGMTILRNRIGSGGLGDSIEPNSPGSSNATPTYVWDGDDSGQVWFSQQARSYGVSTFYADAWSAPGFMKTNNNQNEGGYLCGVSGESCSSGDWRQAYADFLVKYVQDYASVGIDVTHLGFLNEPDYVTSYSSMQSNGEQAADFIKVLSATVRNANLTDIKLTCCDATGWTAQTNLTAGLITSGVENDLGIITSHSYSSDPTTPMNTSLKVWETENADLDGEFVPNDWYSSGAAGEGLTWASNILEAIVSGNVSAYLYWEGAEVGATNSALVDISGTTPQASKRLWALAHYSRFIRPGAVRIDANSDSSTDLKVAAFRNIDGTVSTQVINSAASVQDVTLAPQGFTVRNGTGYVSEQGTEFGRLGVEVSAGEVTGIIPGHSMVTFVLEI
ncbi:glycoside hydrolase [Stereum hirsutum FP-91666 SS1]|uniref:Glycoside hydrolase n=1 Tax=Stereum hirsutum (strain FP-91666) TaxID=721885 RepID=R7RW67_STEHR|nr:glycoside hydrolase [Stereum hirsutum FP-91666 SS1]EIM79541.1 glycoside hydrolase [Stereum hirsutum FP-91666 SS1]